MKRKTQREQMADLERSAGWNTPIEKTAPHECDLPKPEYRDIDALAHCADRTCGRYWVIAYSPRLGKHWIPAR